MPACRSSPANWLALPGLSPGDRKRLAVLCRLPMADLPAPYEGDVPARLAYCHRCLVLNPLDVTAPYWRANWLVRTSERWCPTHGRRYEYTSLSALRQHCNMKRLLRFISQTRAARARAAK